MTATLDRSGFDPALADAFGERMLTILNHGALALAGSIGHRTRLFDTIARMAPSTSAQIAEAAGLQERYVREWLGAMVVGGIVRHDAEQGTYHLPPEHALWLTRSTTADNIARTMQIIPNLAQAEEQIIRCFREGGGVPYSAFPRFHEVMAEESRVTVVERLLDTILPAVPGLIDSLVTGISVMDLGCGRGEALREMARSFPRTRFVGYDLLEEAIESGRASAAAEGLTNLEFRVQDAATIADLAQYDLVTAFDAIHHQAKPAKVLENIRNGLRAGGIFLMQDIAAHTHLHGNLDHPTGPFLYTFSLMHCMPVSLVAGGDGLGTMWGREMALDMLTKTGFSSIDLLQFPHDITNDYFVCRL